MSEDSKIVIKLVYVGGKESLYKYLNNVDMDEVNMSYMRYISLVTHSLYPFAKCRKAFVNFMDRWEAERWDLYWVDRAGDLVSTH